jgi:hypothetical protein
MKRSVQRIYGAFRTHFYLRCFQMA